MVMVQQEELNITADEKNEVSQIVIEDDYTHQGISFRFPF